MEWAAPVGCAWVRTRDLLWRPFRARRWAALGSAAFLAGLAGGGWTGIQWRLRFPPQYDTYVDHPLQGLLDALAGPLWFAFRFPRAAAAAALGLLLLWISSRAKFVFLDCVLHGRAAFRSPWRQFGRLGDSLFVWRAGYLLALWLAYTHLLPPMERFGRQPVEVAWMRPAAAATLAVAALLSLAFAAIFACAALFLESFVVPLMYRDRLGPIPAWGLFLSLARRHPLEFTAYAATALVAFAGVGLALVVATIVTACIAPLVLSIPLVSSIALLPLSVLFRSCGPEFLAAFGPEWRISPSPLTAENPDP